MPYVILTRDKPDRAQVRLDVRPQHLEYLDAHKDKLLAAGAVINDDGTGGHGTVIIVDTDDREEAEQFVANDPFTQAGLFESTVITRWRKVFFNFEKLI